MFVFVFVPYTVDSLVVYFNDFGREEKADIVVAVVMYAVYRMHEMNGDCVYNVEFFFMILMTLGCVV